MTKPFKQQTLLERWRGREAIKFEGAKQSILDRFATPNTKIHIVEKYPGNGSWKIAVYVTVAGNNMEFWEEPDVFPSKELITKLALVSQ